MDGSRTAGQEVRLPCSVSMRPASSVTRSTRRPTRVVVEQAPEFLTGRTRLAALVVPPVGCVLLATLAATHERAFRLAVREDSLIEWAEVASYAVAAAAAVAVVLRAHGVVRLAYLGVVVAAVAAIGEELSWGQRIFGVATPAPLAAGNRQQELNLHNLVGAESPTRLVLLGAALYGVVAALLLRPGPFVPPRALVPAFAVVVAYFGIRYAFLSRPTYVQAKFSEWPEFCFAAAIALTVGNTLFQLSRQRR